MEFKKSYTFRDSLFVIIFLGFLMVLEAASIIFLLVYGLGDGQDEWVILCVVLLSIGFIAFLVIILILSTRVIIDEEKIELKWFKKPF